MRDTKEIVVISSFAHQPEAEEDTGLAAMLSEHIPSRVERTSELSISRLKDTSTYLFRCIYGPSGTVETDLSGVYAFLDSHAIRYRNVYNGKGDQRGKKYLAELYGSGYPVVPTFFSADAAAAYEAASYLVKPLVGGSGVGITTVSRAELAGMKREQASIIQPKIEVAYETSYVFINDAFQYALKTRGSRWDLGVYEPTERELEMARAFIAWNPVKGIQRVDCIWDRNGAQYLLELEDWCPFLSLFEGEGVPREKFVSDLLASLDIP